MPRLFTGLELPESLSATLAMLRGGLHGARWMTPDTYHITLRFLGDIDEATAQDALAILGQITRAPFDVQIDGLTAFGGDRPRALVASVVPTPALMELQAEHERLMRRIGFPPETRKFTPHVTLARLRNISPFQLASYLGSLGHFPPLRFGVQDFVMFSSRASTGGGPYLIEAIYPLEQQRAQEKHLRFG